MNGRWPLCNSGLDLLEQLGEWRRKSEPQNHLLR